MLSRRLAFGTFVASQILLAHGLNSTGIPGGEIIDANVPSMPSNFIPLGQEGMQLWRDWQDRAGDDLPPRPPFRSELRFPEIETGPARLPEALTEILYDTRQRWDDKDFMKIEFWWPEFQAFRNHPVLNAPRMMISKDAIVDTVDGTFITWLLRLDNLPGDLQYSELVWDMWKVAVQATSCDEADYSTLDFFMMFGIMDPETVDVIKKILHWQQVRPNTPFSLEPGDEETVESDGLRHSRNINTISPIHGAFFVLLTTPYGKQLMMMLTNNKQALDGKGIKSIGIEAEHFGADVYHYHMWAVLG